jgi:hypothetical protein
MQEAVADMLRAHADHVAAPLHGIEQQFKGYPRDLHALRHDSRKDQSHQCLGFL